MSLYPFIRMFPEQGEAETRVAHVMNDPALPTDGYGMLELYCIEPKCDCRRVMINVVCQSKNAILATISYGFDREEEMAGPFLDPLNPQSKYAEDLLKLVKTAILSDRAYVKRLESHYRQVKKAVKDPMHPVHRVIKRDMAEKEDYRPRKTAPKLKVRWTPRNAPCPCGSGKRYKKCCGV